MGFRIEGLLLGLFALVGGCGGPSLRHRDAADHRRRGSELFRAGRLEEARLSLRIALAVRARDRDSWWLLAQIEERAGRPGAALLAAERAGQEPPGTPDIESFCARLRARRDQSLRLGTQVPVDPALAARVRALFAAGARQSAAAELVDWVMVEPAVRVRGVGAVRLFEAVGDAGAAGELQELIVREAPKDVEARLEWARLLFGVGRQGRAEQELDEAVWAAADRGAAMALAAAVLERVGRERKACALRSRALQFGVDAAAYRALAGCFARQGDAAQARAMSDRACALDPGCRSAAQGDVTDRLLPPEATPAPQ